MNQLVKPKLLFITPAFLGPGRIEATGGLISNLQLCQALSEIFQITILTSDSQLKEGSYDYQGLHYEVHRPRLSPGRLFRWWELRKFLNGMVETYLECHSVPQIVFATAATIPLIRHSYLKKCVRGIICRAYEDFGCRAPRNVPFRERLRGELDLKLRIPGTLDAYCEANLVITNSDYMKGQLRERFDVSHVEVLHPWVSTDWRLPQAPPPNTVGFVNRTRGKNATFVRDLALELPHWKFKVFGVDIAGKLPSNLNNMGWEKDALAMYGQAKTWLVPSQWPEPYGRVAMEARALGLYVIASDRGGLAEAVGNDPAALLSGFTVSSWADAIRQAEALPRAPHRQSLPAPAIFRLREVLLQLLVETH